MSSPVVVALLVNILVHVLPLVGIEMGTESLTITIQSIVTLVTGIWAWFKYVTEKKALLGAIHVNAFGGSKKDPK